MARIARMKAVVGGRSAARPSRAPFATRAWKALFVGGFVTASVITTECGGQVGVCPANETECSGLCTSLDTDPHNCGACGAVCGSGTVCYGGSCATSCGGGTTQCGQSCFDTNVDPHHCGACDVACPQGDTCVQGACVSTCAPSQTPCASDAGVYCANTSSDNANCGACGHVCSSGTTCVAGACAIDCAPGLTACGSACVDLTSDLSNCAACGQVCTQCISGRCVVKVAATPPNVTVGGVAVDGTYVYWTDAQRVYRADKAVNPPSPSDIALSYGSYGIAVAPTGPPVVWAVTTGSPQAGSIGSYDGQSTTYLSTSRVWSVALDANNAYWVGDDGVVRGIAIGTSTPWTIATGQTPVGWSVHNIAADGTNVYWLEISSGSIRAAPAQQADGGAAKTVFDSLVLPWAIAVDSTYVYWSGSNLWRGPKDGSAPPTMLAPLYVSDFVIDSVNAYFVDYQDGVKRVPLGGGTPTKLVDKSVYGGGDAVGVAVDATGVYWTIHNPQTGDSVWKATPK